ncbi:ATP/GTP-binding protein [Limnohabitans sp. Hippo3]|uniref:AAA family ATPase n=1 Tax=Limnohabitans sp. Hippo3 TaxID=1597956 RepID=UPI001E40061E|nr:AAA family ATPase [Limnohabitans sp. Hippo3]
MTSVPTQNSCACMHGTASTMLESANIAKAYVEASGTDADHAKGILDKYSKQFTLSIEDFGNQVNEWLSGPLLWDEPESNLNPKLMRQLVEVLLELSRNGQQIILATHDYVLLKWFDLLMDKGKGDQVRFHVLSRDRATGHVRRDSMDD